MENLKQTITNMGRAGIGTMGYCFTLTGTWGRNPTVARGGAESQGWNIDDVRDDAHPEWPGEAARVDVNSPIPEGYVWKQWIDGSAGDHYFKGSTGEKRSSVGTGRPSIGTVSGARTKRCTFTAVLSPFCLWPLAPLTHGSCCPQRRRCGVGSSTFCASWCRWLRRPGCGLLPIRTTRLCRRCAAWPASSISPRSTVRLARSPIPHPPPSPFRSAFPLLDRRGHESF